MASTWSRILDELKAEQEHPGPRAPWARVLTRKIQRIVGLTNRPLLIYASACTTSGKHYSPAHLQIDASDKIGFTDVLERLEGPNLDIIIHSPGGFAEAAETIVEEIRRKFSHVRFIVPAYAKSAATMMVMASDEILLDEDAELGPIDPQMLTPNGVAPAEAIKEQFLKASEEILADAKKLSIWIPILQPMGPALLVQCDNAIDLSKHLVKEWLTRYMFRGTSDGAAKAARLAEYLGSHAIWKSHGRRIKLEHLTDRDFGLNIRNLREEPNNLYASVWEAYCTMDLMFANTATYKFFYNSLDDAMVRQVPQPVLQVPIPQLVQPPTPQTPPES